MNISIKNICLALSLFIAPLANAAERHVSSTPPQHKANMVVGASTIIGVALICWGIKDMYNTYKSTHKPHNKTP